MKKSIVLPSTIILSMLIPTQVYAAPFNYDESKSLSDNVLDNCAASPAWLTSLKSLFQISPSKEKCDEAMVALYKFCYMSVGFLDSIAEGFGRTIEPGSLGAEVKEKCGDERLLNYEYPTWFQNVINERSLNQPLMTNR